MNDLPPLPNEEIEYINDVNTKVTQLVGGLDVLIKLGTAGIFFASLGDTEFEGFILAMISYGYILKEEELMDEKQKFSIDDFLENK